MWCRVSATTWSSSASRSSTPRSSGPRARSNGRPASSPARARASASRAALRQPRQVDHGQREGRRRLDHLHRRALRRGEDRAQRLVAAHDLAEAARQHRGVERPFDAQRHRHVVERAARLELVEEPEALLGEGERQGPLARHRHERRSEPARAGPPRRLDPGGEVRHRRGLEEVAQRQLDAEGARAGATSPASPAASGRPGRRSGRPPRPARAPRTSAQMPARTSSTGVRGAR